MNDIKTVLYTHIPHWHKPRNVNEVHRDEQGFNVRLAVWLTNHVGTMVTAYIFTGIGIGSLVGVFTNNTFLALLFGSISSYLLQLVLLPVIMTGQNVLSRKQEMQIDEMDATSQHSFHDIEQVAQHLGTQDDELLKQTKLLQDIEHMTVTEVLKYGDMLESILSKLDTLAVQKGKAKV